MPTLLIVDDEPLICRSFTWVFSKPEVQVLTAATLAEGQRRVEADCPDVIVLDYQLPDGTGLDLFDHIRERAPSAPVIFLTAHGTTDTAIEAMKRGAFDYLAKPFDLEQMTGLLERAFEAARAKRELPPPAGGRRTEQIIGHSAQIREIGKQIGRVAPLDVTVLILGESGTGKELVARAIHQHSKRAAKPFVAINCAAIPEGLVESELFGHEPGAFTGARGRQVGRFEQADGGTVFLDEIGDMPPAVQAKMLRVLQDQRFERVGGRDAVRTQVRVLAATNQNLDRGITTGRFRADLYYRLKEVTLNLPPLRERAEDIPGLAGHFLSEFAREVGRDIQGFAPEVLAAFGRYPWPGNVRELRGVIKEAALRTTGRVILPAFLPPELADSNPLPAAPGAGKHAGGMDLAGSIEGLLASGANGMYARVLAGVERELITRVLRHTRGHQGQACERLGIDRKTLRSKLRDLGITLDKIVSDRSEAADSD
jgi:two-component system nitrogen regulation response regulator GlnG